jgi:hypothetical protein
MAFYILAVSSEWSNPGPRPGGRTVGDDSAHVRTQIRPTESILDPTAHQAGICHLAAREALLDSAILPNSTHRLDLEGPHFGRRQPVLVVFARWLGRLDVGGDLRTGSLSDVILRWASMLPRRLQSQTCAPIRAGSAPVFGFGGPRSSSAPVFGSGANS